MLLWKAMASHKRLSPSTLSVCFGIFLGFGFAYLFLVINEIPVLPPSLIFSQAQHRLWENASAVKRVILPQLDIKTPNHFHKKLEGKGVISSVHGGIGNQLYHYACTYALARDLNRPLFNFVQRAKLLSSSREFLPDQREFALDKFQIPLTHMIDQSTIIKESSISYVNDSQLLFRTYPTDNTFLKLANLSYCQSEAFFTQYKKEIIAMFQLRPEVIQEFPLYVTNLEKDIEKCEQAVAVHIRRGDLKLSRTSKYPIPISYQHDSILRISKMLKQCRKNHPSRPVSTPKFFIFSDDIEYCRRELAALSKTHDLVFVSSSKGSNRTTSLEDFYLMTKCKHFIIPNSTFSWWAAYLGTNKGDGLSSSSSASDGIVIASEERSNYWESHRYKSDRARFEFYKNVIHGFVLFPKGWIIYSPPG